jgi:hypothetical protein
MARFKVSDKIHRTADGIVFDSKNEMKRYMQLCLMQKAGIISALEIQPAFGVEINHKHYCTYTADFAYYHHERCEFVVEDVKVAITEKDPAYRLRKKAAELFYDISIEAVDCDGNRLGGRKKAALPKQKKKDKKKEAR